MSQQIVNDLNVVAQFLARRDVDELTLETCGHVDAIVLLGSSVLLSAEIAAQAVVDGISETILVSGGIGHSTQYLSDAVRARTEFASIQVDGVPEAHILRDILVQKLAVPRKSVVIEDKSTNCGSNARESKAELARLGLTAERLILIQDPTMQRRTHASFERAWRGEPPIGFISYAPFVPLAVDGPALHSACQAWTFDRFVSLVLGEIPRLADAPGGYGPKGRDFIEHVELPHEVIEAHERLTVALSALSDR